MPWRGRTRAHAEAVSAVGLLAAAWKACHAALPHRLGQPASNSAALDALALLAPPDMTIVPYRGLASLPAFNPDLDGDLLPDAANDLRQRVGAADALVISSPEYARGIAGALKNLLDWLVGDTAFPGKAVALINASPRAEHAPAQLRLVLTTMSARVIEPACVTLPLLGRTLSAAGIAADECLANSLGQVLSALAQAIREPA